MISALIQNNQEHESEEREAAAHTRPRRHVAVAAAAGARAGATGDLGSGVWSPLEGQSGGWVNKSYWQIELGEKVGMLLAKQSTNRRGLEGRFHRGWRREAS